MLAGMCEYLKTVLHNLVAHCPLLSKDIHMNSPLFRREALKGLMKMLEPILPVKQQFFDSLSVLDSLVLQGSLLIDFSITASIPANLISGSNYDDVSVSVWVNRFEATASFSSTAFSLNLPISLPSGDGAVINFGLTNASFSTDFFVNTTAPIDIVQLFSSDQNSANLGFDYGGTLEAILPLSVGAAGVNIDVDLLIKDPNLSAPNPVVDYAIDLCDVSGTMRRLFDELKALIVEVIKAPFEDIDIEVNIDKITDPLVLKAENALANFTDGMNIAFSSADCARRYLEILHTDAPSESPSSSLNPSSSPTPPRSIVRTIKDAISSVNAALKTSGIVLSANVSPYFKSKTFSIGASVSLSATIEQTATQVLDIVKDYISNSTTDSSASKLGFGSSNDAPVIDLSDLLSKVALAAGFDVTFDIDLSLPQIQDVIFKSKPLDEALRKGITLYVNTWGAFTEVIVDPIDVAITLFGKEIQMRDSHFALSAELRSRGKFSATVNDMINGSSVIDTAPLIPDLVVPLSTEFVFDISASEQITVSPIMSLDSDNLVDGELSFDFDVDMSTFLSEDFVGNNTLLKVLQDATTFLEEVKAIQPELNAAGNDTSALNGFFSIVDQLNDLGGELSKYINLVNQGMHLVQIDSLLPIRNLSNFLS